MGSMRRAFVLAIVILVSALPARANDSPTATKFLRDYVGALRLVRAGDLLSSTRCDAARGQYAEARKLIELHTATREWNMRKTAVLVLKALDARASCPAAVDLPQGQGRVGPLSESAFSASWALVYPDLGTWVGARDRSRAIRELDETFGPLSSEIEASQSDLEIAAAILSTFLANPPPPRHTTDFRPPARPPALRWNGVPE